MDTFIQLQQINLGLSQKFPDGNNPFQIMTRLLEECGELAEQVHIFEGSGIKRSKHGEPDKVKLAKEVQDVMRCALQIAAHYQISAELQSSIQRSHTALISDGFIEF